MQRLNILSKGKFLSSSLTVNSLQCSKIGSMTVKHMLGAATTVNHTNQLSGLNSPQFRNFSSIPAQSPKVEHLDQLQSIVGKEHATNAQQVRQQHGTDESHFSGIAPDYVVFPATTEEVSRVVKYCYENNIPITPFGTGTGLEGGVNSLVGGVTIAMTRMDKVVQVNQEDFDCTVEAAVTWRDLNQYLSDTGLFFPVDPGASASLGGMASTNASGTNAVYYGTMKENILNLEVVLPNGEIVNTSGRIARPRKSAAGLNLTELFVGAEGILGIITKVTLRLYPMPETLCTCVCHFDKEKTTIDTVIELIQNSIPLSRIEFIDSSTIRAANSYSKTTLVDKPTLFLEISGNQGEIEPIVELTKEIIESNGGSGFEYSTKGEERSKLWKARHELYYACRASRPGHASNITDVCVPISRLTDIILKMSDLIKEYDVNGFSFGHVGDGNFHSVLTYDRENKDEFERVFKVAEKLGELAIELGGSCTGEHGIGRGKMHLLEQQFEPNSIELMRTIKKALDPKMLFNMGKVIHMKD